MNGLIFRALMGRTFAGLSLTQCPATHATLHHKTTNHRSESRVFVVPFLVVKARKFESFSGEGTNAFFFGVRVVFERFKVSIVEFLI